MLDILLAEGVSGQWLAEHLADLLGQKKFFFEQDGPPWWYEDQGKWQLDRNNNFWLRPEGHGFRATARYEANCERLVSFVEELRGRPEISSVSIRPF